MRDRDWCKLYRLQPSIGAELSRMYFLWKNNNFGIQSKQSVTQGTDDETNPANSHFGAGCIILIGMRFGDGCDLVDLGDELDLGRDGS